MIYTNLIKKALRIAFETHKDQFDKAGLPYIFHPFHLAEQMETEDEICVALLHDVVEDSDITFDDLRAHGFSSQVVDAVALLTHYVYHGDCHYMYYIRQIKTNPLATKVKLADLRHNSDITRLDEIDEKMKKLLEKYQSAIELLCEEDTMNNEEIRTKIKSALNKKYNVYDVKFRYDSPKDGREAYVHIYILFCSQADVEATICSDNPNKLSLMHYDILNVCNDVLKDYGIQANNYSCSSKKAFDAKIEQRFFFKNVVVKVIDKIRQALPKIKIMIQEKYPNVYEVTHANTSIVVVFLEKSDFLYQHEDCLRFVDGLRENIAKDCNEILTFEYGVLPVGINVKFSYKEALDAFGGDLVKLAFSDWDHGSRLY